MVQCGKGSENRMIDADCKVHVLIHDVEVSTQYGTAVNITFVILGSTIPAFVGKEHKEFFNVDDGRVDMFYNIAEAVGVITDAQRKAAAKAGVGLDVDERLLKGRQLCAEIKMEPNMRKNPATGQNEVNPEKPGPFPRIGFRTYSVIDPRAKDIPKDMQMLAPFVEAMHWQMPSPGVQVQSAASNTSQQTQQNPQQGQQQQQQNLPGVQQGGQPATAMNW